MVSVLSRIETFTYRPALACDPRVTRRDPSPVIHADGCYHIWYSKNSETHHGFTATIWHALSRDGTTWEEREEAVAKGAPGSFDECGVFTPSILAAENRYWMTYTAMPLAYREHPHTTQSAIGLAVADNPYGPWCKVHDGPILRCSDNPSDFDSLRVDDTCFVVRDGQYWMYYKGRQQDRSPLETKMGLAIADQPAGPYRKHSANPVLASGHEVCVWPCRGGVAALVSPCGPEAKTLQYSTDGVSFERVKRLEKVPHAPGPFRDDCFRQNADCSMSWGVAIGGDGNLGEERGRPYLLRWAAVA